jgi:hypothetical protein
LMHMISNPGKTGTFLFSFDNGESWVSGQLSHLAKLSGAAWPQSQSSVPAQKSMEGNQ